MFDMKKRLDGVLVEDVIRDLTNELSNRLKIAVFACLHLIRSRLPEEKHKDT